MLGHLGFYLLFLCCITSLYGFMSSVAAAKMRHRRLYRSSRIAATASGIMVLLASIILWYLFFQRDYSIAYIYKNSSNDLPLLYTFSAFWSSMEGSHLLWTLLLSVFCVIAHWTASPDNEHIMPYVSAALQIVLCWMFFLAISFSDPFKMQFPIAENGMGKNPLLQHPYMAIHPPILFTGYTTLAIPFAYAIAALCYGDITEGWLRTSRRWALIAWVFLTAGIALGGRWAYVELGWAGYWAWDPVENSSFLPWLLCTCLLHGYVIQAKIGHLKRLGIILAVLAFFMCYFGTFITRSGIIQSVHSFADGNIGPNYLVFLAAVLGISGVIYGFRAQSILPSNATKVWGVSKESALIVTQFLLLAFAAIIFIGTMFPIISEHLTGQRISIQAPYFNAFAPWIGLALVLAIAFGNLMRYNSDKITGGKKTLIQAAIFAVIPAAFLIWMGGVMATVKPFALGAQIVGFYICCWTGACLLLDFLHRLREIKFNWRVFFKHNLAYTGALVAHLGFLIAITGFLGNYRGLERQATLSQGQSTELYGYQFTFTGINVKEEHNYTIFEAPLVVTKDGVTVTTLLPGKSRYPTKPEMLNEIGLYTSLWYDLYAVVADFDKETGKKVTLQIHINPTVRFVWISIFVMCFGGLIAIFDRHRGVRSRDVIAASWEAVGKPGANASANGGQL